jgi:hypothetical protein
MSGIVVTNVPDILIPLAKRLEHHKHNSSMSNAVEHECLLTAEIGVETLTFSCVTSPVYNHFITTLIFCFY